MIDVDLLRKDECQPLTQEQMNEIKSQFHPSNTANVNIVPYEIYDEDGVEQVVGEVRKTIDGVKKKKPLYKKNITCNTGNGAEVPTPHNITNLDQVKYLRAISNDSNNDWRSEFSLFSANNRWGMAVYVSKKNIYVASGDLYYDTHKTVNVTIRYTKTTDEWENV